MLTGNKLRVGVIFGGRSGEHEVSLMSARSVLEALDSQKYEITQIGITHDGAWIVGNNVLAVLSESSKEEHSSATLLPDPTRKGIFTIVSEQHGERLSLLTQLDVVFPVLHGSYGEDGALQGVFEMADTAYVGAGVLGSSLAMDKGVFKDVMRAQNIPVLDSKVVLRNQIASDLENTLSMCEQVAPYPLFVKPANLGSSVGISKCNNRSDLGEGLQEAARYDRRVLVERGINGREIEVSVLGNDDPEASVPGEIIPEAEFYSYDAKYHDDHSELKIPADIPLGVIALVQDCALQAYKAIDCAGMARVDFLLEKDTDQLYLNEINTIPGFTRISMYPKLWAATGKPYSELLDNLIELAIERKADRDLTERKFER
jgi:D-alanine-D-alanine ligase